MTKKQAAAQKAAWILARNEGRTIRYTKWDATLSCNQFSFVAYPTKDLAEKTFAVQQSRIAAGESIYTMIKIVKGDS